MCCSSNSANKSSKKEAIRKEREKNKTDSKCSSLSEINQKGKGSFNKDLSSHELKESPVKKVLAQKSDIAGSSVTSLSNPAVNISIREGKPPLYDNRSSQDIFHKPPLSIRNLSSNIETARDQHNNNNSVIEISEKRKLDFANAIIPLSQKECISDRNNNQSNKSICNSYVEEEVKQVDKSRSESKVEALLVEADKTQNPTFRGTDFETKIKESEMTVNKVTHRSDNLTVFDVKGETYTDSLQNSNKEFKDPKFFNPFMSNDSKKYTNIQIQLCDDKPPIINDRIQLDEVWDENVESKEQVASEGIIVSPRVNQIKQQRPENEENMIVIDQQNEIIKGIATSNNVSLNKYDYEDEPANDENCSKTNLDLNESIISSSVMTHVYQHKTISSVKTENNSFLYSLESFSRLETNNNFMSTQSISGEPFSKSVFEDEIELNHVRIIR